MPRFFLIVILALLTACAQPRIDQPPVTLVELQQYVGGNVSELIKAYGAPVETISEDAFKVYKWDTRKYRQVQVGTGASTTGLVATYRDRSELVSGCIFVATVSQGELVSSISFPEDCS